MAQPSASPSNLEKCIFCEGCIDIGNLHPDHARQFGAHPRLCRRCGLCFGPYGKIWSPDLEKRIVDAKATAGFPRQCFMCGKDFNLLGSFYRHMWYKDAHAPDIGRYDTSPEWGYWVSSGGLDFLYPNLFARICPECFQKLFWSHVAVDYQVQLSAVRELGERIGKLPTTNFPSYMYYCQSREDVESFLLLLQRLPDPNLINARFGSFFQLLVKSGLLPEGSRRMRLGTLVKAKDGDMCFSLSEREIDNWFYKNGIIHAKEVKYPKSNMRCDWEIFKDGKRYFVEYFGLMNIKAYQEKTILKKHLAESNGITFIGIAPECNWESLLASIFLSS